MEPMAVASEKYKASPTVLSPMLLAENSGILYADLINLYVEISIVLYAIENS